MEAIKKELNKNARNKNARNKNMILRDKESLQQAYQWTKHSTREKQ